MTIMKTLKLFIVSGILTFLMVGNTFAQSKKDVNAYTEYKCIDAAYAGEEICGDFYFIITSWDNKFQVRAYGIGVGADSGDLYTVWETDNASTKAIKEGTAANDKYVLTFLVKKDGAPAIVCHYQFHVTVDATGELAVEFEKYFQSNW